MGWDGPGRGLGGLGFRVQGLGVEIRSLTWGCVTQPFPCKVSCKPER